MIYFRPLVEYCCQVWSPYHIKDIKIIEKVQKYYTRSVCRRAHLPYSDYKSRLTILGIKSLEVRRIFLDLVLLYKILHRLVDLPFDGFFKFSNSITRGHSLKIQPLDYPHYDCRRYFFSHRTSVIWNSLPNSVVSSDSLNIFKERIRDYDLSPFCKVFT